MTATTQECCEQFWTSPGGNTQQSSSCMATYLKTIKVRWTRHTGHCWRSRDKLISDVLLWTPAYGWAKAGRPARTYIQQLCEDTEYSLEDLRWVMRRSGERGSGIFVLVAQHDDWYWALGLLGKEFANGPGERGSIPSWVIPKIKKKKLLFDISLLITQHYKVCIKGKVEQSKEKSCALPPLHLGEVVIEKGTFVSPSTMVDNFTWLWDYVIRPV